MCRNAVCRQKAVKGTLRRHTVTIAHKIEKMKALTYKREKNNDTKCKYTQNEWGMMGN